ncbi:MAG: HNH endonuclease, partial [Acidimicrobiales bacterium]|nr:HNH endonuclease [Acidimicrobiales bacterium]
SAVGRLVLDAEGEVLDAGRQARQFNRAQRRAMARRDGGCAFPGCDRPPEWCDAHHLDFWDAEHGLTDLDRGCLLCRRHHNLLHKKGWTLDRDVITGIFTATAPDGRTFTNNPRRRQAKPRRHEPPATTTDPITGPDPPGQRQPSRC